MGLQHFRDYFSSYYFGRLIKNTVFLSAFNIILSFPAPIILALLINEVRNTKFKRIVQTVTYLPHFISIVIVCALLRDFFSSTGLVNQLLGTRIDFFNKEECFRPLYILSGIWQEVGWGSIVYLSAITSIDNSLYEAAEADGANCFQKLIHVTLPGIATTISVMFILRVGRVMTVGADKVLLMYNESIFTTADIISTFVYRQGLLFHPLGFTLDGYKAVFANRQIWSGYFTTLFNLIVGTSINIFLTLLAAYGISRKDLMFKKPLTIMIVFTMFFNSGIIPRFLVVQDLGLYDTRMSMILPTAINVFNLVIMRTAIEGIPNELEEAALLDGASHFTILFKVITPLIKSTIAVLVLYYGVTHWNQWYQALMYVQSRELYPLQRS